MAVKPHELIAERTHSMEGAIYSALDAIDAYGAAARKVIADEEAGAAPNEMLVKRMKQFASRADTMSKVIEDGVLTELMFCLDRLFSVEMAERGEFI
ncbi:MAG: hypothetical protein OEX04_05855 [Acidimicrobiia bacterium]|nr:hypothetical protein [Acidimicrobiia bacterium]MDH4306984.1 hypothetical protein [Acidimicrobiia bacterium]MDH5294224.1 hypothetical protein [Acidimicrobiia bacterium]